jgi:hypothetical protein
MALVENFDSYNDGDLNGQGSWTAGAAIDFLGFSFKVLTDNLGQLIYDFEVVYQKIQKVSNAGATLLQNFGKSIGSGISTASSFLGGLLSFDEGGYVPGPVGAPTLAVVHGGEFVSPVGKSGGGSNITVNISGNKISNDVDIRNLARQVGQEVMRTVRLAQQV